MYHIITTGVECAEALLVANRLEEAKHQLSLCIRTVVANALFCTTTCPDTNSVISNTMYIKYCFILALGYRVACQFENTNFPIVWALLKDGRSHYYTMLWQTVLAKLRVLCKCFEVSSVELPSHSSLTVKKQDKHVAQ